MKHFFLSLISILFFQAAFGQITIEQIYSDSLALQFVKQENYSKTDAPQWKFFYLTEGNEWNAYYNFSKEKQTEIINNAHYLKWAKADLNNDGKDDLIISGYIARKPGDWNTAIFKLIVFMSESGKGHIEYNLLTEKSEKYPAYFDMLHIGNNDFLHLIRWQSVEKNIPQQNDTLHYNPKLNDFVNYHVRGLLSGDIQKIQYRAFEDFQGSYHEAILENTDDKNIDLHINVKQSTDKLPHPYRAKVAKGLWLQLDTLAQSLIIPKDSVTINEQSADKELATELTIFYKNGTHKKITDIGAEGSYSLMTLYGTLETIIQNVFEQMQERQQAFQQISQPNDFGW